MDSLNISNIFIIGCRDIGSRVASLERAQGRQITALVRSPEKAEKLHDLGINTVSGDLDTPSSLEDLPTSGSILYYFAPPPGGGITDTRMRNFCVAMKPGNKPGKVIYMSTTGVYGDCGNQPVSEDNIPNPQTTRAKRRLDAETVVLSWGRAHGVPVVILRVTGIYGPGRIPLQHLLNGSPVVRESEALITNRIHSEDLASVCTAAAEKGEAGDIFNVSDGEHSTMTRYFNALADLLGIPKPPQISRDEASMTMPPLLFSYFNESRKIDNRKMLEKLKIHLRYPTLADGIKSCLPKGWVAPSNIKI